MTTGRDWACRVHLQAQQSSLEGTGGCWRRACQSRVFSGRKDFRMHGEPTGSAALQRVTAHGKADPDQWEERRRAVRATKQCAELPRDVTSRCSWGLRFSCPFLSSACRLWSDTGTHLERFLRRAMIASKHLSPQCVCLRAQPCTPPWGCRGCHCEPCLCCAGLLIIIFTSTLVSWLIPSFHIKIVQYILIP